MTTSTVTDDQLRQLAAKPCACGEPSFVELLGPCIGCVAAAALEAREAANRGADDSRSRSAGSFLEERGS